MGIRWFFNNLKLKIAEKIFSNRLKNKIKNKSDLNQHYENFLINKYKRRGINGLYYTESFMGVIDDPKYTAKVDEQFLREQVRFGGVFESKEEWVALAKIYNK